MKNFISKMASLLKKLYGPCPECGQRIGKNLTCKSCMEFQEDCQQSSTP